MRVHVVSDVHGNTEALARAGDGADALVCLGDFVLFLDYFDSGGGIFAKLFGAAAAHLPHFVRPPHAQESRGSSDEKRYVSRAPSAAPTYRFPYGGTASAVQRPAAPSAQPTMRPNTSVRTMKSSTTPDTRASR